ncbi:beta-galactosidase [Fusarium heterosporum]|uniref:Beta-galactosidase n=1 Tax=Fusarium heterosporum TaxID=42747 RepID=A0A8H5TLI6_FUSHE|nr:beta-galactosidase [Fusarium heterosporum]
MFAPESTIACLLEDWFGVIHPLAPILLRRQFLRRLDQGVADVNAEFCGLVISVCAATKATLPRRDYGPVTVDYCVEFLDTHGLLKSHFTQDPFSMDRCIALYNIGTAMSATNKSGLSSMRAYHALSEAAAGARYLAYYRIHEQDEGEQQLLRRLIWLLFASACADIFGRLPISLLSQDKIENFPRPLALSDDQMEPATPNTCYEAWHGDETTYVPGLNSLSDLFLIWQEVKQVTIDTDPQGTIKKYLIKVQHVLDNLPPELRWRGGLSRPANVTDGHDVQIANLFVTSLNIRSNILQRFSPTIESAKEHQKIVDDLLEILYHLPRVVFDANGSSLVPKIRDIGAAYLEQTQMGNGRMHYLVRECTARNTKLMRDYSDVPHLECHVPNTMAITQISTEQVQHAHPHLRRSDKGSVQLIVKGKPFLMLPGELHNSSLSSAKFMSGVWPAMKADHINTLLGSVTWEMIEPKEGHFDFSELDRVLQGAREHDIHLVLLWFGTYKNGLSTYAPTWVKRDFRRFPRVQVLEAGGIKRTLEMITPLSDAACDADSRAFSALMRHLAEVDSQHQTVLMVQVQNETGVLGDSRDRSRRADEAFAEPVPSGLLQHLSQTDLHTRLKKRIPNVPSSGSHSWESIFGVGAAADEAFMAHLISSYVGRVAAAGKKEYPIPLYTNTWLNIEGQSELDFGGGAPVVVGGGDKPGIYPSGGPCPHVLDIWRFNTASLDLLAPDLYFHDYETVCQNYTEQGNTLFIPEQRRDEYGARRVWLAYATYGALGASPFGIDTGSDIIGREFKLLNQTKQYLLDAAPKDRFGFYFDEEPSEKKPERWTRVFGDIEVIVERCFVFGKPGPGGGMVIHLGNSKFLLVGRGFHARFKGARKDATFGGILWGEEKEVDEDGNLKTLRILNGDETRHGEFMMMPNDDPDYGGFPIAVTPGARTCIAEVEAYWIAEDEDDR